MFAYCVYAILSGLLRKFISVSFLAKYQFNNDGAPLTNFPFFNDAGSLTEIDVS